MKKITALLLSLIVIGSQNIALAGIVSFDQVAVSNDITVAKYNADLNTIYTDHNSNIQTSNVKDGTLLVGDFDSSASPQVRTDEGAACDFVYTGLLSSTTVGTLTGSISAGTAYPVGYRISKSSATAKTFTASKWTFVDLDFNGNFQYSEVSINGATPSVAANSIRLERVSTDTTKIADVLDLRKTSCASGPFSAIADVAGEATLADLFTNGQPHRRFSPAGRTPNGFAQGLFISYDTTTTFKVTSGSAYINGKYRSVSQDITVTTGADAPSTGGSGIDTGSVTGGPLKYYVYGVADQDSAKTLSISFSTSPTAPTGVTNARLLGAINIDNNNLFTSYDTVTAHAVYEKEIAGAWVTFDGAASTIGIKGGYNVSGLTDGGTGVYTVTIDSDFNTTNYVVVCTSDNTSAHYCSHGTKAVGSTPINVNQTTTNAAVDGDVDYLAFGDTRK